MYSDGSFNVYKEFDGKFDAIYEVTEQMLMENRFLLYWILLHDIEKCRDMKADFSILPISKYDETFAAKSKYTLQPAYYDIALQRKLTPDDESAVMPDIF